MAIGTSFNMDTYSSFQPNIEGIKGGMLIPFDWMCAAMGDKATVQDLLLMNYHGMNFSPILRTQRENYNRLKSQGLTIQTRIPLADGEATIPPKFHCRIAVSFECLTTSNPARQNESESAS